MPWLCLGSGNATGDMPVIAEGTDFASMQFDVDILKPAGGETIYVDGVAVAS